MIRSNRNTAFQDSGRNQKVTEERISQVQVLAVVHIMYLGYCVLNLPRCLGVYVDLCMFPLELHLEAQPA